MIYLSMIYILIFNVLRVCDSYIYSCIDTSADPDGILNGLTDAQRVERLCIKHLGLQGLVKDASIAYLGGSPLENPELAAHFEASQQREELLVNLLQATIARMESGFKSNEEDIQQLSSSTSILKLDLLSVKGRVWHQGPKLGLPFWFLNPESSSGPDPAKHGHQYHAIKGW